MNHEARSRSTSRINDWGGAVTGSRAPAAGSRAESTIGEALSRLPPSPIVSERRLEDAALAAGHRPDEARRRGAERRGAEVRSLRASANGGGGEERRGGAPERALGGGSLQVPRRWAADGRRRDAGLADCVRRPGRWEAARRVGVRREKL
nr:unnamed protein product [Digitaria exilis]CAB3500959.1 unnamed protein product [Digitaria exilis]